MKYHLLLFIVILLSCSANENAVRIYSEENESYAIEISTIETKINENGEAQCSKHTVISYSDSLYLNYGNDLQHLLADAYETSTKYIQLSTPDSLMEKYFDIKIRNKTSQKIEYKKELIHHIKKALPLSIITKDSVVEGYKLSIADSKQLQKHVSPCAKGTIKFENYIWTTNRNSLKALPKIFDEYTSHFINFEIPSKECYSLTFIVNDDVQKMNEKLNACGLALIPSTFTQTFYELRSK